MTNRRIVLDLTEFEAQHFSAMMEEVSQHLSWQSELAQKVADVVGGRDHPQHDGYVWLRKGVPRKGEWYDDGHRFEPTSIDWKPGDAKVHVYEVDR